MQRAIRSYAARQQGAVLIVALVLLLVLTILGTAGLQDTTMEERMAGNFRDLSVALETAEAALREGEEFIPEEILRRSPNRRLGAEEAGEVLGGSADDDSDVDGIYAVDTKSKNPYLDTVFTLTVSIAVSEGLADRSPLYYVEVLPGVDLPGSDLQMGREPPPQTSFYRISGKGFGISPNSEVILQSTFWNGL